MRDGAGRGRRRAARRPARPLRRRAALAGPAGRPRRRGRGACPTCGPWPSCASTASPARCSAGAADEGGDEAADDELARELSASYFAHRDREAALFPDTIPGLDALRAGYRLGLLSNGSRLPETVGLASYFESVVFAQDHRVAKPDKGIFEVVGTRARRRARGVRARRRSPGQRRRRRARRRTGVRCGSTVTARCRSPTTAHDPTPWWPRSTELPDVLRRLDA